MRQKISFLIVSFIIFGLFIGFGVLAQEDTSVEDEITAEDLEISEPKTLPDSPFYFLKDFWRGVKTTFTLNAVRKAGLRLRYANERLIEAKKLAEKTGKEEIAGKAIEKYQKEMEKIRDGVERFKEKAKDNPKIDAFLDRYTDKAMKQQILIEKLEVLLSHNPKALEKIRAAKERVLENYSRVIEHLEENKERVRQRLEEHADEIQEKIPATRESIEQYKQKIQEKVENLIEKRQEKRNQE